ncbi:hypothetical protein L533_3349 [Bordetella bronchiseptica OSU553]|nr:hypothetical protein L533_3349 [Bordetella bronchiseptica OSU553]
MSGPDPARAAPGGRADGRLEIPCRPGAETMAVAPRRSARMRGNAAAAGAAAGRGGVTPFVLYRSGWNR